MILLLAFACGPSVAAKPGWYDGYNRDAAGLDALVRDHSSDLLSCYKNELAAFPETKGVVEIEWSAREGRFLGSSVFANTTGRETLGTCALAKFRLFPWPSDVDGGGTWTFAFRP